MANLDLNAITLDFDTITTSTAETWQEMARERDAARFRKHYHSGNYQRSSTSHKGRNSRSGIKATLLDQPICAIDGEGYTDASGYHHYTLLQAVWPTGRDQIKGASLTAREIFEFLLNRVPEHHTVVIYGGSYDMNMWVRVLPHRPCINMLLEKNRCYWMGYEIQWIERKYMRIKHGNRSVCVYDVVANWQTSFVKACDAWHVGDAASLQLVRDMKEHRGDFLSVDPLLIEEYCWLECEMLADLCRKLFDAIRATPYRPSAVYGPGALAGAALRKEGVKRYMAQLSPELEYLSRIAYFGGRFDCAMFGWWNEALLGNPIYQYDIKSAYPDQIRYLPCLKHATWRETGRAEVTPYGMFHVDWEVDPQCAWPPFPHRDPQGNIRYLYTGEGWYHGDEVLAALEMYGPECIRVTHGYALERGCEHTPFAFVDALFQQRKAMEYGQGIVIKLILNSLYGKLAQQVGTRNGKSPTFQCFYWAGAITAGTRAKILRALRQHPSHVIGIATDSLVSLCKLDLPEGAELGQWDPKELTEYAQISNGVYHAIQTDGSVVERSRGFERTTLDWDECKRWYRHTRGVGTFQFNPKARFVTLREARQRTDRSHIECRWIGPGTPNPVEPRRISFNPSRRFPGKYSSQGPTRVVEPYAPEDIGIPRQSQPFKAKSSQDTIDARIKFNAYDWQDYA